MQHDPFADIEADVDAPLLPFDVCPATGPRLRGLPFLNAHRGTDLLEDALHGLLSCSSITLGHRSGDVFVGLDGVRVRVIRHQPLPGAAGEDLGHHPVEGMEHLVPAAMQEQLVKSNVRGKEVFQVAGLSEPA